MALGEWVAFKEGHPGGFGEWVAFKEGHPGGFGEWVWFVRSHPGGLGEWVWFVRSRPGGFGGTSPRGKAGPEPAQGYDDAWWRVGAWVALRSGGCSARSPRSRRAVQTKTRRKASRDWSTRVQATRGSPCSRGSRGVPAAWASWRCASPECQRRFAPFRQDIRTSTGLARPADRFGAGSRQESKHPRQVRLNAWFDRSPMLSRDQL